MSNSNYAERLNRVLDSLLKARERLLAFYQESGTFKDAFVQKAGGEQGDGAPLPFLYGFEAIFAPLGYLNGLIQDDPAGRLRVSKQLVPFQISEALKDNRVLNLAAKFNEKLAPCFIDSETEGAFARLYAELEARPYADFWTYDAMSWLFGACVDARDILVAMKEKQDTIDRYANYVNPFLSHIIGNQIEVSCGLGNTRRLGWYVGPKIKDELTRKSNKWGNNRKEYAEQFFNHPDTIETYVLFTRSVLAVYDIAREVFSGNEALEETWQTADKNLIEVANFVKDQVATVRRKPEEYFQGPKHCHYLVQLLGCYAACVSRGMIKLDDVNQEVIDQFISKTIDNLVVELQKGGASSLSRSPKEFKCWVDVPAKDDKAYYPYPYVAVLPVAIRSLANLMLAMKANGKFWRENLKEKDKLRYENLLDKLFDVLQGQYLIKAGDEAGLWSWGREEGQEQSRFELAYTGPAAEALGLYAGYLLLRAEETKQYQVEGVLESGEGAVLFDSFLKFRDEWHREIRTIVRDEIRDAKGGEPAGGGHKPVSVLDLPLSHTHLGHTLGDVIDLVISFFEALLNLEDEKGEKYPENATEELRRLLQICLEVTTLSRTADKRDPSGKIRLELQDIRIQATRMLLCRKREKDDTPKKVTDELQKKLARIQDNLSGEKVGGE